MSDTFDPAIRVLRELLADLPSVHHERPGVLRAIELLRATQSTRPSGWQMDSDYGDYAGPGGSGHYATPSEAMSVEPMASSAHSKVHFVRGPVIGESRRALCGRSPKARLVWSVGAVEKFRLARNADNVCKSCLSAAAGLFGIESEV